MFDLKSRAAWQRLTAKQKAKFTASLTDRELDIFLQDWSIWARDEQLPPPGDWRAWLILAGRGFGKTRTGAEVINRMAMTYPGSRIALVGATAADVRDVMVEGESGIQACSNPEDMPIYEPSKRRVTWPNGSIATTYSAEEPSRLRGPQHSFAWCDEIAAWKYPEAWDQLMFGLRLGSDPRAVVTTTPKPIKLVRDLIADATTAITRGSTLDNRKNLPKAFIDKILTKYHGTRLGRQEIGGEMLEDIEGAMWNLDVIEMNRVRDHPNLVRIVVAIDPAATSSATSDETGIIVAGLGVDGHGYILEDYTMRGTPDQWARAAVDAYHQWQADRIVAEVNQGGEMVEAVIRTVDVMVPYKSVHASRGKATRAEPISALYDQGRVHHVGSLPHLEDQMTQWIPGMKSPDRMDALVWAVHELMIEHEAETTVVEWYDPVEISPI
jgi:phage terminase large subunit-like protein